MTTASRESEGGLEKSSMNVEKVEPKNRESEQETVKRYVRTGTRKSGSGRSSSIMREEPAEGFLSVKARGASPFYGMSTE